MWTVDHRENGPKAILWRFYKNVLVLKNESMRGKMGIWELSWIPTLFFVFHPFHFPPFSKFSSQLGHTNTIFVSSPDISPICYSGSFLSLSFISRSRFTHFNSPWIRFPIFFFLLHLSKPFRVFLHTLSSPCRLWFYFFFLVRSSLNCLFV